MNTGETIALIKALGKGGGGGSSLPPVTSADNDKVLTVKDGAWAAQGDIVLNATIAYDDSNRNYNITITSTLPSASDLESYFNGNRIIVLHFTNAHWDVRLQPELKEVDAATGTYYSFIGEGLGSDYDKMKYVIRFNVNNVEAVSYVGKVYFGDKFIVALTPTSPDFSGTMDKTVAEINAAYEAGQQIVFRVMMSATTHMDVDCTARWFCGSTYPSFNGFILYDSSNAFIFAFTGATDDGTWQTYDTTVYPLTPAS